MMSGSKYKGYTLDYGDQTEECSVNVEEVLNVITSFCNRGT